VQVPSTEPTVIGSDDPSSLPSEEPSAGPSLLPSLDTSTSPSGQPSSEPSALAIDVVEVIVEITQDNPLTADDLLNIEEDVLAAAVLTICEGPGRRKLLSSQCILVGDKLVALSAVATTTSCDILNPIEPVQCSLVEITIREATKTDFDVKSGKQAIVNALEDGTFASGISYDVKLVPIPSTEPSSLPSSILSLESSLSPSAEPSSVPGSIPSVAPSSVPSSEPSSLPSSIPSIKPSLSPSAEPSSVPSADPTGAPSSIPSSEPSFEFQLTT
jgi:hypothetical protein